MKWINTKDKLPPEGKYVLARHNRGTWHDSTDQENVNCVVVKLSKGISIVEREQMKKGELPDPIEKLISNVGISESRRSSVYCSEDEEGNNLVPYNWVEFGPDSFFGQSIICWTPIL